MGRKEKAVTTLPVADVIDKLFGGNYIIREAAIKDQFCNYIYEITDEVGEGNTCNVKGKGIIKSDMEDAFEKLHVHLAVVDDVFKHSSIDIDDIDKFHNHDITYGYHVTAFKIKGTKDNESVILIGSKHCALGRIELESPKISLGELSSYKWYNELQTAIDNCRHEVKLYNEGKYTPVETEDETPGAKQMTIDAMTDKDEDDGGDKKLFIPSGFQKLDQSSKGAAWDDEEFEKGLMR